MTDPTRPRPLGAAELAPDTIAAASADADKAKRTAVELLQRADYLTGSDTDDALANACAIMGGAYAQLAVADETRALRLMLTEQLRALGRRP